MMAIDQLAAQRQIEEENAEAIIRFADELRWAFYGDDEPGFAA